MWKKCILFMLMPSLSQAKVTTVTKIFSHFLFYPYHGFNNELTVFFLNTFIISHERFFE